MPARSASGAQHRRVGEPVELRVASSDVTRHARDCGIGAPTGRSPAGRLGRCSPGSRRSWRLRSAGAAPAPPRAAARSAAPARAGCGACRPSWSDLAGVPCFSAVAYEGAARDARARAQVPRRAGGRRARWRRRSWPRRRRGCSPAPCSCRCRSRPPGRGGAASTRRSCWPVRSRERTGCAVVDCLERSGGSGTQVGRDRAERARALAGLDARLGRRGATRAGARWWTTWPPPARPSRPCAEALRGAGCEHVAAVTYARTLGRL